MRLHALATFRLERGLTQAELAKRAGCARSMIALIETRRRSPSSVLLRKLCKISGASADDILEIDINPDESHWGNGASDD